MASLHQLLSALQAAVTTVTTGLPGLTVQAGIDWPSPKTLMNNVRGGSGLVSVFDRKLTRNTTRWNPIQLSGTLQQPTVTSTLSSSIIPSGGSATLTLGASVAPADAVSLVVSNGSLFGKGVQQSAGANPIYSPTAAVVTIGSTGQTLAQMATALAAEINADAVLPSWVEATAVGAVITLTSKLTANEVDLLQENTLELLTESGAPLLLDMLAVGTSMLAVQSLTGNVGSATTEIARRSRQLQVTVWAGSIEDRDTISNPIETMIALMETFQDPYGAGLPLADGTLARLELVSDFQLDQATPQDTYRRDFLVSVDYPITTVDTLYTVLAPVFQYQLGYTG